MHLGVCCPKLVICYGPRCHSKVRSQARTLTNAFVQRFVLCFFNLFMLQKSDTSVTWHVFLAKNEPCLLQQGGHYSICWTTGTARPARERPSMPSTCINMYHVSLVPGRRRQSWSYTFVMRVSYLFIYFLFFDIVAHAMPTKQSCSRFCGFQTASMPHHKICMFTTYLFIVCFDGSVCSPCAHREETHYEAKLHWVEFGIMNHVACFCYIAFTRCYDNVIYTTMCMKG